MLQELAAGTIKAIEFENERFVRPTGILVRRDRVISQETRYLIELLRGKS